MALNFNPLVKKGFDESGSSSQAENDTRYVNVTGDIMTGDLIFPATGFVMKDTNGVQWRVTVETSGNLTTTEIVTSDPYFPYGLLLSATLIS